jgi:hypothetical protein
MKLNGQTFTVVTVVDDDGQLQKFTTKELFQINKNQLMTEMLKFPEDFGWWTRLEAEIAHQKRQLKTGMEQTEAKVSMSVRKGGGDGVKLTEKTIEAMIQTDPLMVQSIQDFNEICRLHDVVSSVVETLRMKSDMMKLHANYKV